MVGLTVGTIAFAHGPLGRAVATSYVDPQQTSRLYTLISMLETGGALLGRARAGMVFQCRAVETGALTRTVVVLRGRTGARCTLLEQRLLGGWRQWDG